MGSNCSSFSGTHSRWQEHVARSTELQDCSKKSGNLNNLIDTRMQDSSSLHLYDSQTIMNRTCKHTSRWDRPADLVSSRQRKGLRMEPSSPQDIKANVKAEITKDGLSRKDGSREETNCSGCCKEETMTWNLDDDAPPGFSLPLNCEDAPPGFSLPLNCGEFSLPLNCEDALPGFSSLTSQNSNAVNCPSVISKGHLQERFKPHFPVSYGIPLSIMHVYGSPEPGTVESWAIAPAMPFQPFPPLPPYPRDKSDSRKPCTGKALMTHGGHKYKKGDNYLCRGYLVQGISSTSGASLTNVQIAGMPNQHTSHQERGLSKGPGRRYYRQQEGNHLKHRMPLPWLRKRFEWGFKGNHPRNVAFNSNMERAANEQNGHHLADVNHSVDIFQKKSKCRGWRRFMLELQSQTSLIQQEDIPKFGFALQFFHISPPPVKI